MDMDLRRAGLIGRAAQREIDGEPVLPLGAVQAVKAHCRFDIGPTLVKLPTEGLIPFYSKSKVPELAA